MGYTGYYVEPIYRDIDIKKMSEFCKSDDLFKCIVLIVEDMRTTKVSRYYEVIERWEGFAVTVFTAFIYKKEF
jgi:hypothetical protein